MVLQRFRHGASRPLDGMARPTPTAASVEGCFQMEMTIDDFLDLLTRLFPDRDNFIQHDGYWEVILAYPEEPIVIASGVVDAKWDDNAWDGVVTI
jgi:hypothetical protein